MEKSSSSAAAAAEVTRLWWCTMVVSAVAAAALTDHLRAYIVHMDTYAMPASHSTPHAWYNQILSSLSDPTTHLYTYEHVLDGFSAVLSSPWILKPDIMAPGVDILAAWVPNRAAVPLRDDFLVTDYALVSGTSMSCPHISGVAALIKSVHKDWSPAAIRSAMMTTARVKNNADGPITDMITGEAATPLDFGGGHVDPSKASDPGLVYDLDKDQYVNYLCAMNYTSRQIRTITKANPSCENASLDLNYPSFILLLNQTNATIYTFTRVLTNVAEVRTSYRAVVDSPAGMKVVVRPDIVSFAGRLSTAEFNLTVEIDVGARPLSDYVGNFGYLSWVEVDGTHVVRSSIVSAYLPLPH
uniref:Uncharacterized protein n=1 Tax=Kalanchoe fedtschenkoi TaxID=63787 RepID=A0A7N0U9D6_KALFE